MTTQTQSLAAWLLERIAEDEAVALACRPLLDPTRVLAECEAKRRIVELHQPFEAYRDRPFACVICVQTDDCGGYVELDESPYPCETLRALAAPYAGAEGWQEGWGL